MTTYTIEIDGREWHGIPENLMNVLQSLLGNGISTGTAATILEELSIASGVKAKRDWKRNRRRLARTVRPKDRRSNCMTGVRVP